MILVEDGAIVDFCAEPGRYQFDASQAPSALAGSNSGFAALAHSVVEQFKAGGQRVHTQRVYFINLGEIQGFKWGSGNITFDHWEKDWTTDKPIWHIATTLMGNGVYSIQVTDPGKFFSVIGAQATGSNGSGLVRREDIEPQIKSEAIAAIRQGVAGLNKLRIGYQDIAANEYQLTKDVDKLLDEEWHEARGISVFKIAINMLDADEKSKAQITKFQETRGYTDPSMLGAYMGIGQTQAAQAAAANTAGAITGFAAMGMMGQNNAGANIAGLMQQGAQQQAAKPAIQSGDTWTCSCGSVNTGKFCPNCGSPKPQAAAAAFCTNCGQPFPDPANPPKFCPNCGTKIG
jgi:membrane protease subunit (stomatin/prohibitin family)